MKINKNINAITVMELLVAITVIGILAIGALNVNFKYTSDKQKLEIFTNKITSEIERIRNNSLIGKGIGINLIVPPEWKIEFNNGWNGTSSGNIITSYSGATWIQENVIIIDKGFGINNISCLDVNGNAIILNTTETGTIIFEGGKYKLSGDCPNNYSNIEIENTYNGNTGSINFDVVSGLIKK
ncbi:MAG: hypothetical protein PHH98_00480 [Candidatus Gracilibacteria bacterium]|nr:hypothetical protein [Candidatus Gracilibacteria bacterium]